jgi:hypothetical protein
MTPSLPCAPQIGSQQVVEHIWIWFSDNGNIRKWDSKPFPEGTEYVAALSRTAQAPVADGVREANGEGPSEICQIDVESVDDGVVIILHDGDTGWPAILDIQCAVELRDKLSVTLASSDPTPATEAGGDEKLRKERDEARELAALLAERNFARADGKTIVDFLKLWLEQARDENQRLKTSLRQPKPQAVAVPDGWRLTCATEGCGRKASVHFIRGDIGSYYCHDCYLKVQSLPAAPVSHGGEHG